VVLILAAGTADRVWTVAEVCGTCAQAIPRSRILKQSDPHPPTGAEPASVSPTMRRTPWPPACPVCRQEAIAETGTGRAAQSGMAALAAAYAGQIETALRSLGDLRAGRTAPARLLALLFLLRSSDDGTARLVDGDLVPERTGLSEAAVGELLAAGWLRSATKVPSPGPADMVYRLPAQCTGAGVGLPLPARRALHGWVRQTAGHELLLGQPADVRLAAVYLTARSVPQGQVRPRTLARHCCLAAWDSAPVLRALHAAGWLHTLHLNSGWKQPATYRLADGVHVLLPRRAPVGRPAPSAPFDPRGREADLAAWVHAYHRRHGHPPRLDEAIAAHCTEDPSQLLSSVQFMDVARQLQSEGWLEIADEAGHPVRPGPRYWQRISVPRRSKRHALSPRFDAPHPLPAHRPWRPPRPEGMSPQGQGPALPLTGSRPATPMLPPAPASSLPEGIWLIPGARAVLQPGPE
jgi:hypothetical protein